MIHKYFNAGRIPILKILDHNIIKLSRFQRICISAERHQAGSLEKGCNLTIISFTGRNRGKLRESCVNMVLKRLTILVQVYFPTVFVILLKI